VIGQAERPSGGAYRQGSSVGHRHAWTCGQRHRGWPGSR
jgi:hypothetical protein